MNQSPIIGILCVDIAHSLQKDFGNQYKSYIAASYVKFLESAGARVAPIWIGKDYEYYKEILQRINGILLPGGAVFFNEPKGFSEAGTSIFKIASEMNTAGNYLPLWGTCLGFELLTYASAGCKEHRQDCDQMKESIPLEFKEGFENSKMFKSAPTDIIQILQTEPVTYNFHRYCITEEDLKNFNINNEWSVLSVNKDRNGLKFISSIEHKRYPFYGVQFHPEKNAFEWARNKNIVHTLNSVKAGQYFAEFFVDEARQSKNKFENLKEENNHLIYNFPKTFTGLKNTQWMECYLFLEDVDYPDEKLNS